MITGAGVIAGPGMEWHILGCGKPGAYLEKQAYEKTIVSALLVLVVLTR